MFIKNKPEGRELYHAYHERLTAGQIREYLKDAKDEDEVELSGGDDWSDSYSLTLCNQPEGV